MNNIYHHTFRALTSFFEKGQKNWSTQNQGNIPQLLKNRQAFCGMCGIEFPPLLFFIFGFYVIREPHNDGIIMINVLYVDKKNREFIGISDLHIPHF